jgi:hypothetical protein
MTTGKMNLRNKNTIIRAKTQVVVKKRSVVLKTGRWEEHERVSFMKGFRQHGRGKWKEIADMIPTR